MCGVSDLIILVWKKIIEEINKIQIIILVEKSRFIFLFRFKIITKIPERITSNNALVSLVAWEVNGSGYSKPNKYPDILKINFIWF